MLLPIYHTKGLSIQANGQFHISFVLYEAFNFVPTLLMYDLI